jgi:hypothetical protein
LSVSVKIQNSAQRASSETAEPIRGWRAAKYNCVRCESVRVWATKVVKELLIEEYLLLDSEAGECRNANEVLLFKGNHAYSSEE